MVNVQNRPIALAQVYAIIEHSDDKVKEKIPASFLNFVKSNMDKETQINLDFSKDISKQKIEHEAKILLGIIYRDFLCDIDTKKIMIAKDKKELAELDIKKREKYNPDNLFKKNNIQESEQNTVQDMQNTALIEYKPQEAWYTKIWSKIKSLFKRY